MPIELGRAEHHARFQRARQLASATLIAGLLLVLAIGPVRAGAEAARSAPRHQAWSALLAKQVADGRVDYRGLAERRDELERYLATLEKTPLEAFRGWPRNDRMAFWINAYNAYTVKLILDHYPLESIWNVTPLWRRPLGGPFKLTFIPLGHLAPEFGSPELSLDNIEHGILRPRFGDRRVHFAVVCASKGCPPLRPEAFEGPSLERQLDRAAADFLADESKNRYQAANNTLYLSPIFDWFAEDFAETSPLGSARGAAAFFGRFGPAAARRALAEADRPPKLEYTDYDWSLNERAN